MTSWFRPIDVGVWVDEKFRQLSRPEPSAQWLWLYLLTGEHTQGLPGLYVVGPAALAEALGWSLEELRRTFAELETCGMACIDAAARVVFLPNALKYQPPQNPSQILGWGKEFSRVPSCELTRRWLRKLVAVAAEKGPQWVEAVECGFNTTGLAVSLEPVEMVGYMVDGTVRDTVSDTVCDTVGDTVDDTVLSPNTHPNTNTQPHGGSGKPDDSSPGHDAVPYAEIVAHLNERSGKRYRPGSEGTRRHIRARWREGHRLDDFKAVIDTKCAEWRGTDLEKYLRPDTLFGSKFEGYLNSHGQAAQSGGYRDLDAADEEADHDPA
ncbi:MAG TPA: conserved phage C-terminal domain-containing protein [Candidatus Krumholzibacteria bacterium]|nr:conserved phage C-terminal domain-containing protein [Candidatus Krumholzibacteria bacterium]HPD73290.1 conserved phage C-terminal domain-containing protein [Candidatus Krumholzibacteria bacterium]HRY42006.1 conserved phage C-terminal domain-containing protein [Candidatus Krumholzibacteria bacterium]